MRKVGILIALTVCLNGASGAQSPPVGEWTHYGGNAASQKYSALDQINKDTVGKLKIAWRWTSPDNAVVAANPLSRPGMYHDTPLMVKGVLYTVTSLGQIAALNPATGASLWVFDPANWKSGRPGNLGFVHRGISYWTDGTKERLLLGTSDAYLISVDAKSGALDTTFGQGGRIDLMAGLANAVRSTNYSVTAAPIICRDVVVVGASIHDGPTHKEWPRGDVSGFDVRTGKRLWTLHSIPQKGEFGNETWGDDSFSYSGSTNVWTNMSADEELGYVYLPFGTPTDDWFGGHRPGANLFAESLVALDVKTGKRMWHFQAVHHGIWDYDTVAPPILLDVTVGGRRIKAVAQVTKQAFTYVFDRVTGQPVWPIEERPVEKGNVPGEWYSPTQPFVTKPPAYERQGVTVNDLLDFTPELRAEGEKVASMYKMGPIFTPPVVSKWEGPRGTLMIPEVTGGANWQGGSFDPDTKRFYIFTNVAITSLSLTQPENNASDMLYVRGIARNPDPTAKPAPGGGGGGLAVRGLPLIKPPYATITAIDMNKGEQLWRIPHGDTPDNIKNHPALKGLTIPRTGRAGRIGVLTTKTLLIAGEGGFATTPDGRGAYLRAYDKATGADAGQVFMPAPQTGSPMTYMVNGVQYIAVAVSGPGFAGELLVYKLGT